MKVMLIHSIAVQTYIRPKASGKELLLVTRITVFVFGMFTGVLSIILFVVRIPTVLRSSHCHFRSLLCSALPHLSLCSRVSCTPAAMWRSNDNVHIISFMVV